MLSKWSVAIMAIQYNPVIIIAIRYNPVSFFDELTNIRRYAIDLMHDDVISHCIVGFVVTVFSLRCISLRTVVIDSYTTWNQIKISLQTMKKISCLVFLKTLSH